MPCGDAQNPPSQWVCGDHPGTRWEVNDPLTNNYYRILITNPTTNHLIVAPYVTYAIQCDHAEVSRTYSRGHSIHTQVLQPIPMVLRVDFAYAYNTLFPEYGCYMAYRA